MTTPGLLGEGIKGGAHHDLREKLARITLDAMLQFVGLLDAHGSILEIDRVALDAAELKLADVEGKPFWTTFWWQVSPAINTELRKMIARAAAGEFVRWETQVFSRAGVPETIIIDASLTPVKDKRGNVVFIAAEGRDITERKAYEREIAPEGVEVAKFDALKTITNQALARESEARLEAMLRGQELQEAKRQLREVTEQFQAMYDQGLFAARLRLDGTVADINRSAVEVCGFSRADILDQPFWECGWWNRSPEVQAWVRNAVEQAVSGELFRGESRYFWGDGSEHVVDFACMPIRDAGGRVVVAIATGMDITERVQGEQNQRALEAERQRSEALAEIDRAKTQFFANISHEFRTPLTLMLGPLGDAMADVKEPLGTLQHERIAMAERNGLRLQKLVNALLDFSRVEAGRIQAAYEPTDLASLTHDLASSFRAACEKAGLTLTIDTQPLPEPVFVDHEMWEKIVLNLLSNAFKFTLEGGLKIDVFADGAYAVLRVSDTGTGIPESEVPRIFDRFHRVEGARGRTHEGTGIGLALVKELIELHKGTVSVGSVVDEGTTFTVRVPFGHAHLPQDRLGTSRSQVSTATGAETYVSEASRWLPNSVIAEVLEGDDGCSPQVRPAGERSRILLADDNADMRDYLCRLLATQYDCVAVADGEEALEAVRQQRPDLILTDVMMPRLDGFGLLQKLRDDPALRTVPVIVLSARAGDEAKVEGLRKGADDYLVKPFSARELRARVAANIELSRTRAQSARVIHEEAQILELLNKVGTAVAAELDLERAVQIVTDAATELSGAAFGSIFYNVIDENGEAYTLYTISGVPREAFSKFPMPRNTAVFGPTFSGEGVVRSDDITLDPRYGRNAPYRGMPEGHLPVRSYLAVPVKSRSGEVLGGLFFGHPEIGVFGERAERILAAIAVQAGIAIDKAQLYRAAQDEIARRERVEAELRESETRYRGALITGRIAAWETDMVTRTRIWTEEGMQLFGLDLLNGRGQVGGEADEFWLALHPDDKHMMAEFHRTADAQDSYPCEYRIVLPDGSTRWVSGREGGGPWSRREGAARRQHCRRHHDRKKAEEHVELLLREVSHRSKNLLAVVQAIASQTVRSAGTLNEFEKRFAQRLQGLAGSHDLLVKENWRGVPLRDLARQQLALFTEAGSTRLVLEGTDIVLAAAASQSIGLALHELATNAIKYGAWSLPTGRVMVSWTVEGELGKPHRLRLRWAESGGPIVTPPTQRGFGTIVIEQIAANSVNGEVLLEFDPRGLRWTLSMPLDNLVGLAEELERAQP